ncbi:MULTISPECIES: TrkA family potassium uptake protein [Methanobacterium]|jgi:trk system potassium uptake protein TrkA|uniref:Potassium uptake protein TrkA family n=1 Tax=Methanobacterium formicicum TaxID=2162 RepID=A0A089ZVQ2_METFO|nr:MULTISPECIES: TrkA family potassium uptake protein [Methanobacterium]AIS32829.1 potassium uptake protein TrkA family [Methanobacterium formicicum]AXV39830.1 MAG: TrkA family potassium uptake protein [Methanobacterium sp. BAmetb5]KUK73355.1 MAG: TRK system potassium uptake protein TrkA [Methanobacterium sp. 42_16]MBF4474291.1 TrkA family potassium uptake protein [Methanobacterium formicicum]MDD4809569.1 TrkA family potassium uptake protein [Methanobacterium formicicum]
MYVVVMGGGRVGLNLASFLIADGHDVTLIENDENLCTNAAAELDALVICGNGTDTKTLEEANVSSADVFVAATGNDEANLLACILVREFNIPKIIARVSEPSHGEAFRKVGIDSVISPEITAASYVEKLIIRPKIADLVVMGKGDAELLDFNLENEKVVGKKIGDISPTDDFIIVAVYENGDITIPKPEIVLKKGMKVSILVKTKAARAVMKRFTK